MKFSNRAEPHAASTHLRPCDFAMTFHLLGWSRDPFIELKNVAQIMKTLLPIIALAIAASLAPAQDSSGLTVLKVCQDDMVLHTSDGADAGHVSYIVMDPGSRVVESVLVSGGVLAERTVAVPFDSIRFSGREARLTEIDQQRLISAPVIERSRISSTTFDRSVLERSRTHFGVSGTAGRADRTRQTTSGGRVDSTTTSGSARTSSST